MSMRDSAAAGALPLPLAIPELIEHILSFTDSLTAVMALGGACRELRLHCKRYAITRYGLPQICQLTTEQHRVAAAVLMHRRSVFLTGNAGCGKTFTFAALIAQAKRIGRTVVCCAPTGVAACPLDGVTVHQLFGLVVDGPYLRQRNEWLLRQTLSAVDCLFVDEASMLSEDLFMVMDRRLRTLRNRADQPFGGLQMVMCGDPFQLPPIGNDPYANSNWVPRACFEAPLFRALFTEPRQVYVLTKSIRQATDERFSSLLNTVRMGQLSEAARLALQTRLIAPEHIATLRATHTHLYCRRREVVAHNERCLADLPTERQVWAAVDQVYDARTATEARQLLESVSVLEQSLSLKVGAPVLLRVNCDLERHLVNGSRGVVIQIARRCELGLGACVGHCGLCQPNYVARPAPYDVLTARPPRPYHRKIITASMSLLPVVRFDNGETLVVLPHYHDVHAKDASRQSRKRKAAPDETRKRRAIVNQLGGAKAVKAAGIDELLIAALTANAVPLCGAGDDHQVAALDNQTWPLCAHLRQVMRQCGRCIRSGVVLRSLANPTQCIHGAVLDCQCSACHLAIAEWMAEEQMGGDGPISIPLATRVQLPLSLAYSLTVHKSQGMTLDRICLPDLQTAFTHGQVYVALSRARTLDGVVLAGTYVSQRGISASPAALAFWDEHCPRPEQTAQQKAEAREAAFATYWPTSRKK